MDKNTDPRKFLQNDEIGISVIAKPIIAVFGLLMFLILISLLPGFDRLVPGLPITYVSLVIGIVTFAIVILFIQIATHAKRFADEFGDDASVVLTYATSVVYWVVIFIAIVVAYEGFGTTIEPVLVEADIIWMYDLAFFLISMIPILLVGYYLYKLLDPLTEYCVNKIRRGTSNPDAKSRDTFPRELDYDEKEEPTDG